MRLKKIDIIKFYLTLPVVTRFSQIFDESNYRRPPDNWVFIVTDVVDSTHAIEAGRYKDVNVAGALPAMAITNYIGHMQFPFIFGGDGMVYLVPNSIVNRAKDILADTRRIVKNIFDLDLRVGIVPLTRIYDDGRDLQIARLRVSSRYVQAILDGDGADYAESLIKNPDTASTYQVPQNHKIIHRADFTGFTCRWKPIESPKGEIISLIVKPQEQDRTLHTQTMKEIFAKIHSLFGDPDDYRPVTRTNQDLGISKRYLRTEASVLSRRTKGFFYWLRLFKIRMHSLMMYVLRFRYKAQQSNNSISSDYRKFDGALKMVLSCTTEDRQKLSVFLDENYRAGRVFYGIHVAKHALLTCLIQQGQDEVHFVDSDNGGYAVASKQLKKQIADKAAV